MSWMSTPAMRRRDAKVCRRSFQRKSAIFALRKAGVSEEKIQTLMVENPRNYFEQ